MHRHILPSFSPWLIDKGKSVNTCHEIIPVIAAFIQHGPSDIRELGNPTRQRLHVKRIRVWFGKHWLCQGLTYEDEAVVFRSLELRSIAWMTLASARAHTYPRIHLQWRFTTLY